MASTTHTNHNVPFELDRVLGEVVANGGTRAGNDLETGLNDDVEFDDTSDVEPPSPPPHTRPELHQGSPRHNADRAIRAEYFGNPDRRPFPVRNRGWNDRAAIAEGERISNAIYGPSSDAIRDTSLEEASFVPSGPVRGLCRVRRERRARHQNQFQRDLAIVAEARAMTRLASSNNILRELDEDLDRREDRVLNYRRSGTTEGQLDALQTHIEAFRESDPVAFEAWNNFLVVAVACSGCKVRQYQIIQWYKRGVPHSLMRQLDRVASSYHYVAYLSDSVRRTEEINARERRPQDVRIREDHIWSASTYAQQWVFGDEPEDSTNGFNDYVPKGEGLAMIRHFNNNFEASKVRLQNASEVEFSNLARRMLKFVRVATHIFNDIINVGEQLESDFHQQASDALQTLIDYRRRPIVFTSQDAPPTRLIPHTDDNRDASEDEDLPSEDQENEDPIDSDQVNIDDEYESEDEDEDEDVIEE